MPDGEAKRESYDPYQAWAYAHIVCPNHKEVAKGTFRNLIRSAGLTFSEFIDALKKLKTGRRKVGDGGASVWIFSEDPTGLYLIHVILMVR